MAEALEGDDAARKRELVVTTAPRSRRAPATSTNSDAPPDWLIDFDGSY